MIKTLGVLAHQKTFIEDYTTRHLALVAGYGSGKTFAFCLKALDMASRNVGYLGVLMEPTNTMLEETLFPMWEQILEENGIPYTVKKSSPRRYTLYFKDGKTIISMRSAENYARIAGLNLAFVGIDEMDTIKPAIADLCWKQCQARIRKGNVRQLFTTSTPEGYGFLYNHFEKNGHKKGRRLIRARTIDNPFLPEDYIEDLMDTYPPELIKAYLNGEFTNLTQGVVYPSFNRYESHTEYDFDWVLQQEKQYPHNPKFKLHIGQDFNVGKCYSGIHIIIDQIPYAIAELENSKNTEHVIQRVQELYPDRTIIFYPDSSGKNERSNASQTDITLLKNAGFHLDYPTKNPFIRNRVGSVNARLLNANNERRYFINTHKCPTLTESFEQQTYDKTGMPDKANDVDHPLDACGYFIHRRYPLKKNNIRKIQLTGM